VRAFVVKAHFDFANHFADDGRLCFFVVVPQGVAQTPELFPRLGEDLTCLGLAGLQLTQADEQPFPLGFPLPHLRDDSGQTAPTSTFYIAEGQRTRLHGVRQHLHLNESQENTEGDYNASSDTSPAG